MDNSNKPADLSTVDFNGKTLIFYVTPVGKIAYLQGPEGDESQNDPSYSGFDVLLDGGQIYVNENARSISVVSFLDKDNNKTLRLYYVAPKTSWLSELCSNDGIKWFAGLLGTKKASNEVIAGGTINAIVGTTSKQLKVYYLKKGVDALSMVYIKSTEDPLRANWIPTTVTDDAIKW